jgi:hypothetical protein
MVSSTPGLIAQMAGFLTRKRYKYAMVFVDHYSDFSYVHLMQSQSAEEASSPKQSLRFRGGSQALSRGIFTSKSWKDNYRERHQGVSYAGVTPITKMDDVRDAFGPSRTGPMLINSCASPMAVRNHGKLWPYAFDMQMTA